MAEPIALTTAQVAALLDCGPDTVEARARAGDLPGLQFGRGWVFPAAALAQRLNELALQAAQQRRQPSPAPAAVAAAHPTRRARRQPPRLVDLTQ